MGQFPEVGRAKRELSYALQSGTDVVSWTGLIQGKAPSGQLFFYDCGD